MKYFKRLIYNNYDDYDLRQEDRKALKKLKTKDPEAYEWLQKFRRELYHNEFNNDKTDIHTKQTDKRNIYREYYYRSKDIFMRKYENENCDMTKIEKRDDKDTFNIENEVIDNGYEIAVENMSIYHLNNIMNIIDICTHKNGNIKRHKFKDLIFKEIGRLLINYYKAGLKKNYLLKLNRNISKKKSK